MRFLPTRVHGVIDYVYSLALLASPWLFGYSRGGAETWVPVSLGIFGILYSVFTDYELGLVRILPMRLHLLIDMAFGVFLTASPWLFGFAEQVRVPHVVFGLLAILTPMATQTRPSPAVQARS
ncbi:MAG TPA: SPW repeat protein [Thermoanaerobaculia bacterium]|nr:SPW repeat protein [Thermoanaerobaculia bacterium]